MPIVKRVRKSVLLAGYEPVANFMARNKGLRLLLDCGHRAIIGDSRSNTIIMYANGQAVCHNCGY